MFERFLPIVLAQKFDKHSTKMKFSIKEFFSKCDQVRSFLKSLIKNFIVCAVKETNFFQKS